MSLFYSYDCFTMFQVKMIVICNSFTLICLACWMEPLRDNKCSLPRINITFSILVNSCNVKWKQYTSVLVNCERQLFEQWQPNESFSYSLHHWQVKKSLSLYCLDPRGSRYFQRTSILSFVVQFHQEHPFLHYQTSNWSGNLVSRSQPLLL